MNAVRDYGSGHTGLLAPGDSNAKPDEAEGIYRAHISSLLVQGDYAQLEKLAQQNRVEKGRLLDGSLKNFEFFWAASQPQSSSKVTDADYVSQLDMLNKWTKAYPQSAAARIALAECYIHDAEFARGAGYADSVSDPQWRRYNERTALAEQILLDAGNVILTVTTSRNLWLRMNGGISRMAANYSTRPSPSSPTTITSTGTTPTISCLSGTARNETYKALPTRLLPASPNQTVPSSTSQS